LNAIATSSADGSPAPEGKLTARPPFKMPPYRQEADGYVYFIVAEGCDRVKIGYSRDPTVRLNELQTGSPFPLRIVRVIPACRGTLETRVHKHFADLRLHGEWFRVTDDVKQFAATHGEVYRDPRAPKPEPVQIAAIVMRPGLPTLAMNEEIGAMLRRLGEKNVIVDYDACQAA
jgi:hypothetical protein